MKQTIYATPKNGGWSLTDKDGNDVQEGFTYLSWDEAIAAMPQLWPTNSEWHGKKLAHGCWQILTDDVSRAAAALGKSTSEKKSITSAANGSKGGRPTKFMSIARHIHNEVCGCDSKYCTITDEVHDWLREGDAEYIKKTSLASLVNDWNEYNKQEEKE